MPLNSPMVIEVNQTIQIDSSEAKRIFFEYLERLTQGCWIDDGNVYTEHYTSHRFDTIIGKADEPQFRILRAVTELREALMEQAERA